MTDRLRDVRMATGLTQVEVASRWGRAQSGVARLETEKHCGVQLRTLRSYVEALGGTCRVVVEVAGKTFEL